MKMIETLMVIDDDHVDQILYARIAERAGVVGKLLPFFLAQDALDYLVAGTDPQPDLILLDINMPVMDGFEFLDAATAQLGEDFCPIVIMLTTSIDPRDKSRAEALAVVKDFLNKPLTEQILRELAALTKDKTSPITAVGLKTPQDQGPTAN